MRYSKITGETHYLWRAVDHEGEVLESYKARDRVAAFSFMRKALTRRALFGEGPASLAALSVAALAAGFFTNGATAGLYALIAQSFPVRLRGSGTGLVIGVGRGGAALGPIVAGLLFAAQWPLAAVAGTMALGTVLGAVTLVYLGERSAAGVA